MKVPRFPRKVTVPVLFLLNFLAWLYVYDEYMMSWVFVYPLFMVIVLAFTISAQLAFSSNRSIKDIGLNVCLVLLLLVLVQRFLPMEKIEQGFLDNYYGYIQVDADITEDDEAVRLNDVTLIVRDFQETTEGIEQANKLEIYKEKKLIESITLSEAIDKVSRLMSPANQGEFSNIVVQEVRYVGVKKKGGTVSLIFKRGHVYFKYDLNFNEKGFVWDEEGYRFAGLEMPDTKLAGENNIYDEETNKKIKNTLLKGNPEQLVEVEVEVKGNKDYALTGLKNLGYEVLTEEPLIIKIPFYEIANLAHEEYVEKFSLK